MIKVSTIWIENMELIQKYIELIRLDLNEEFKSRLTMIMN